MCPLKCTNILWKTKNNKKKKCPCCYVRFWRNSTMVRSNIVILTRRTCTWTGQAFSHTGSLGHKKTLQHHILPSWYMSQYQTDSSGHRRPYDTTLFHAGICHNIRQTHLDIEDLTTPLSPILVYVTKSGTLPWMEEDHITSNSPISVFVAKSDTVIGYRKTTQHHIFQCQYVTTSDIYLDAERPHITFSHSNTGIFENIRHTHIDVGRLHNSTLSHASMS